MNGGIMHAGPASTSQATPQSQAAVLCGLFICSCLHKTLLLTARPAQVDLTRSSTHPCEEALVLLPEHRVTEAALAQNPKTET